MEKITRHKRLKLISYNSLAIRRYILMDLTETVTIQSMITFSQNYQITLKNNGSTYSTENAIFITRVVGY